MQMNNHTNNTGCVKITQIKGCKMTEQELRELVALTFKGLNELRENQAKTDAQLAKTDAQLAKTDAQLAMTDAKLKELGMDSFLFYG